MATEAEAVAEPASAAASVEDPLAASVAVGEVLVSVEVGVGENSAQEPALAVEADRALAASEVGASARDAELVVPSGAPLRDPSPPA